MHTLIATVVDGGLGSLEAINHVQLQALWTQHWNLRASARRSPRACSLQGCVGIDSISLNPDAVMPTRLKVAELETQNR